MVVLGIGIDIIEINRIDKDIKDKRFKERVFTEHEIEYFYSRGGNPCHAAGNFAAKEAVLKALGTGLAGTAWKDIEILRDGQGKPYAVLHGGAKSIADAAGIKKILVSISHSRDYAVAQAVSEGYGEKSETCDCKTDEKC